MQNASKIKESTFKLVWFGLFISQLFYLWATYTTTAQVNWDVLIHMEHPLYKPLALMALAMIFMQSFLPKLLQKSTSSNQELDNAINLHKLYVPFIIRLALIEAICIFGLVSSFLQQNYAVMVPHLCISTVLFLKNYPSDKFFNNKINGNCNHPS